MRKRKSLEKLLSWVFTLVLLVGMMPTAGLAEALEAGGGLPSAEQSEVVDTVVLPEEDVQAVAPEDAVQAEDNPVTEEPAVPVEEPTPPVEEPALAEQASIIASGTWGTCPWELTSDGDLRIYPGVGADTDWSESVPWFPWLPYKQYIRRVSTSSGVVAPNNLCGLFMDCYELVEVDGLNLWDTSVTTNFASMFNGCKKLISADLSGLNVKSIESTNCMFENCESLRSVSLQGWDFGNDWDPITSVQMPYMFRNCISLTSINMSGFNTNKVSSMDHFFEECRSLKSIDLSELDAAHCNDLAFMFYYCSSLETIKLPKNLSPQITRGMFRGCQSLKEIDVSSVKSEYIHDYGGMFAYCDSLASIRVGIDNQSFVTVFPEHEVNGHTDWWSEKDEKWYTADEIANSRVGIADTYTKGIDITGMSVNISNDTKGEGFFYRAYPLEPWIFVSGDSIGDLVYVSPNNDDRFDLSFSNNTNVGTATVTLTGKGRYAGQKTVEFPIRPVSLGVYSGASYSFNNKDNYNGGYGTIHVVVTNESLSNSTSIRNIETLDAQTYTGNAITPTPVLTEIESFAGGDSILKELAQDIDYSIIYSDNVNVGTATITYIGKGNFTGKRLVHFQINPADISKTTVASIANQTYTGKALTPKPTVKLGDVTLKEGTDYTLSYKNNTNVGTATITITGKGNLTGTKNVTFKIVAADIAKATVSAIADQTYTGKALTPKPTVKLGSVTLKEGTDYTLSYKNNTNAGTATITITGKGNLTGTKTATFKIVDSTKPSIANATVSSIANQTYTGKALTPKPTVKLGSTTLKEGTDYTLSYKANTNVGTATITITGKGNYTGTKTTTFKIVAASISKATVSAIANQTYTGKALTPKPTVKLGSVTLKEGTDYTLSYKANTNVGTATITITGKGNYSGTKTATFKIVAANISKATVSAIANQTYTGKVLTPKPTVKLGSTILKEGTDYTLSYKANTNVGTATITITGKGNYTGTKTTTFKIVAADISKATVSAIANQTYTGKALAPKPTVKLGSATLKEGTDYTLSYKNNTKVGMATVTVTGKSNYKGTKTVNFSIVKKIEYRLGIDTWSFPNISVKYSGEIAQIPEEYCISLLGDIYGREIYEEYNPGYSGLCYGYAASAMSSVKNAYPSVASFTSGSKRASVLSDAADNWLTTLRVGGSRLTALDLIKYSHVAQFDRDLQGEAYIFSDHKNNYTKLVQAVRTSEIGGEPLVIGVHPDNRGGHALWALGIKSDNADKTEISVYDSNYPFTECAISLFKKNGSYYGWFYQFSPTKPWGNATKSGSPIADSSAFITWDTPADNLPEIFSRNGVYDVEKADRESEWKWTYDRLYSVSGEVKVTSSGKTYTLSPNKDTEKDTKAVARVHSLDRMPNGDVAKHDRELYWVNLDEEIAFSGIGKKTSIGVASNTEAIDVTVSAGSEVILKVSDDVENKALIKQPANGTFEVTYYEDTKPEKSGGLEEVVLKGTGSGVVSTQQKGENILVSGATSLTVSNGDKTITKSGLNSAATYTVVPENKAGAPEILGATETVAMHRLYNPNSGEHFYTAAVGERDHLVKVGWKYEGIGWYAPKKSNTPVYRLYNPNAGDHHYTMSKPEKDHLVKVGWRYEGIGWYSDDAKGVPLYRQYNPNAKAGSHNYTTNKAENDMLVRVGWRAEGIGWYGVKR